MKPLIWLRGSFRLVGSKAVVPVLVLLFVALWFILRGDFLYVFPCVILFLCFSVLLVLRLPRLGKRELISVLFVRLFGLCLFRFVGFLFLLGSGKGCGLWFWHSLDFSLTFFVGLKCYEDWSDCVACAVLKECIVMKTQIRLRGSCSLLGLKLYEDSDQTALIVQSCRTEMLWRLWSDCVDRAVL